MKKRIVIGLALGSLVYSEIATFNEHLGKPGNPHTHFEMPENPTVNATVPISASGFKHGDDAYRLQLQPMMSNGSDGAMQWINLVGLSNSNPLQSMYGRYHKCDELFRTLEENLCLSQLQVDAIRRSVFKGETTEIGGHFSGVVRVFKEQQLWDIGMSFRPQTAG